MTESANEDAARPATASDVRRARKRREITAYARRLTATSGLQGFTVEDLCEHVGVSRRTFFNYFAGKEQAVIGDHSDAVEEAAVTAFLDGAAPESSGVSPTLLDDLLEFSSAHFRAGGLSPEEAGAFFAAVKREPRLVEQLMRQGEEHHRYMTSLVARRERLSPEHPVAAMAVALTDAIVRASIEKFYAADNSKPITDILQTNLAAASAIFAAATPAS